VTCCESAWATLDDCPAGNKCSAGECLAPGECVASSDCSIEQVCDDAQGRCVAAECWPGHTDVCNGYTCFGGACKHSCSRDSDCESPMVCRLPFGDGGTDAGGTTVCAAPPLPRGHSCVPGDDCGTLSCCSSGGKMVCSACLPNGSECTRATDCISATCCPTDHFVTSDAVIHYVYSCSDPSVNEFPSLSMCAIF
jgi:hypothetical protein